MISFSNFLMQDDAAGDCITSIEQPFEGLGRCFFADNAGVTTIAKAPRQIRESRNDLELMF